MLHRLCYGELDVHHPAVGEHEDEEGEAAARVADPDGAEDAPVDLRALAGGEVQLEIDGQLGWPYQADVVAQDGDAAAVSLLAQALKDLLCAIGVRIQQPRDAPLERVEEAAARDWSRALVTGIVPATWRPSAGRCRALWRSERSSGPDDPGSRGSWRTSRSRSRPPPRSGRHCWRAPRHGENVLAQA